MKLIRKMAGALAGLVLSGAAQAALFDRGGGMVYDDDLNITWLFDMNYARTSGFDADGLMTWNVAAAWVDSLEFGGYSDWRLPTASLRPDGPGPCIGICGKRFQAVQEPLARQALHSHTRGDSP